MCVVVLGWWAVAGGCVAWVVGLVGGATVGATGVDRRGSKEDRERGDLVVVGG